MAKLPFYIKYDQYRYFVTTTTEFIDLLYSNQFKCNVLLLLYNPFIALRDKLYE